MAEYSAGMTATIAGTSVRPILSIAGSATVSGILRGFWLHNGTATAVTFRLIRFTAGTAGAGQTETKKRLTAPAATCAVSAGHTADVTVTEDLGYRVGLAAGQSAYIPIRGSGIETPTSGTTPGIGLVPVGTGQICEVGFDWDE